LFQYIDLQRGHCLGSSVLLCHVYPHLRHVHVGSGGMSLMSIISPSGSSGFFSILFYLYYYYYHIVAYKHLWIRVLYGHIKIDVHFVHMKNFIIVYHKLRYGTLWAGRGSALRRYNRHGVVKGGRPNDARRVPVPAFQIGKLFSIWLVLSFRGNCSLQM
jgi:hypothetical protein